MKFSTLESANNYDKYSIELGDIKNDLFHSIDSIEKMISNNYILSVSTKQKIGTEIEKSVEKINKLRKSLSKLKAAL